MSGDFPIVDVARMRELEARAFAAGSSEDALQRRAAEQVARVAARLAPVGSRVVVLVGPGNNGRDAFIAGHLLAERGRHVYHHLTPRHAVAEAELAALQARRERVGHQELDPGLERLAAELRLAALAIDGLLGIGVRGPTRPPLEAVVATVNRLAAEPGGPAVLSVDVPSGIDADGGAVPGAAVRATTTVTLGAVKSGLLRFPAAELVGRLEPRPIGLPADAEAECPVRWLTPESAPPVPPRPPAAHKGTLGWVVVLGGSREYLGAPILSGSAAARSGCGLVALAVPPSVQAAAAAALPEATYLVRDEAELPRVQAERVVARLSDFRALVIGPGLGRAAANLELARLVLAAAPSAPRPPARVVDADALYGLAHWPEWWRAVGPGAVLTPHHGEMARLTGHPVEEIAARSWEIALASAAAWRQIVVLKGAHTVVAEPGGRAWVYPRANPALATAGSGDVLAGLIAGLAAQGLGPLEAARLGVVVHALAAEQVIADRGWRSLLATDLLGAIPSVLARQAARPTSG